MTDANKFWVGLNFEITGKCDPGKLSHERAFRPRRATIQQLSNRIKYGKPWMPAILHGNNCRWQSNANYCEILGLDIDDGMTIVEASANPYIAANFNLGQESASSQPEHNKFRLVSRLFETISHDADGNAVVVPRALRGQLEPARAKEDPSASLQVACPLGKIRGLSCDPETLAYAQRFSRYPAWQLIRIANRYLAEIVGNADPACKDASRFFFGAPDREPFLLNESAHLPKSFLDDAVTWHEAIEAEERKRAEIARKQWEKQRASLSDGDADRLLESALYTIDPDCDYNQWIAIGMALAGMGDQYLSLWDSWSKGAKSYKAGDCDKRWKGFSRKEPKPEVIFGIAKKYGFRFPSKSGTGFSDKVVSNKSKAKKAKPNTGNQKPNSDYSAKSQTPSRPIVDIGNDEFFKRLDTIPTSGLVALKGQPGSGKTTAIAEIIKGLEFSGNQIAVSVTHLESLGRQHAVDCNGAYIADAIISDDGRVFNEDLNAYVNFLSLCAPSLAKIFRLYSRILVIDEPYPLFEFILSSHPCEDDRAFILAIMQKLIIGADLVILAGAEIDDALLTQIEAIRGEVATVIESHRLSLRYKAIFATGTLDQFICDYVAQAKATPADKITMAFFDSKTTQLLVASHLESLGRKPFIHNGDNSGDDLQKSYASSSGLDIAKLLSDGYTDYLHTSSCGIGISIRHNTALIHGAIFCAFEGKTITPELMAQMCDRAREEGIDRRIWCAEKGRAYSRLTPLGKHTTDPAEFLADLHKDSSRAILRMHHAITGNVWEALYQDKCDSPWYWLLAEIECRRNRQMESPRAELIAILKSRGKCVTLEAPSATDQQVQDFKDVKSDLKQRREAERVKKLLAADDLNQSQVEAIKSKGSMTSGSKLAIEKYAIREFYKQPVTAELIENDKKGQLRRFVTNAEQLLDESLAVAATRESLDKNAQPTDYNNHPGLKTDIDKAHWRYTLLKDAGFVDVFTRIFEGEGENITDQEVDQICEYATRHADEFSRAGILNPKDMTDNALIGTLFRQVGLKRISRQYREPGTGQRVRSYEIDQDALDQLRHIVSIRAEYRHTSQSDQTQKVYNQGVSDTESKPPITEDPAYLDELDIYSAVQSGAVGFESVESCLSEKFQWLMGVKS